MIKREREYMVGIRKTYRATKLTFVINDALEPFFRFSRSEFSGQGRIPETIKRSNFVRGFVFGTIVNLMRTSSEDLDAEYQGIIVANVFTNALEIDWKRDGQKILKLCQDPKNGGEEFTSGFHLSGEIFIENVHGDPNASGRKWAAALRKLHAQDSVVPVESIGVRPYCAECGEVLRAYETKCIECGANLLLKGALITTPIERVQTQGKPLASTDKAPAQNPLDTQEDIPCCSKCGEKLHAYEVKCKNCGANLLSKRALKYISEEPGELRQAPNLPSDPKLNFALNVSTQTTESAQVTEPVQKVREVPSCSKCGKKLRAYEVKCEGCGASLLPKEALKYIAEKISVQEKPTVRTPIPKAEVLQSMPAQQTEIKHPGSSAHSDIIILLFWGFGSFVFFKIAIGAAIADISIIASLLLAMMVCASIFISSSLYGAQMGRHMFAVMYKEGTAFGVSVVPIWGVVAFLNGLLAKGIAFGFSQKFNRSLGGDLLYDFGRYHLEDSITFLVIAVTPVTLHFCMILLTARTNSQRASTRRNEWR
jgi:hypothetical protein